MLVAGLALILVANAVVTPREGAQSIQIADFYQPALADKSSVSLHCTIRDVFRDDVDDNYVFLALDNNGATVFAPLYCKDRDRMMPELRKLTGCDAMISGKIERVKSYNRKVSRRMLAVASTNDIVVLSRTKRSLFDVPLIEQTPPLPDQLPRLGPMKARGSVIARWHNDTVLLCNERGDFIKVQLVEGALPDLFAQIEAVGTPETDLYRINLERAQWRTVGAPVAVADEPSDLDLKTLFYYGRQIIRADTNGKLYRLVGKLKNKLIDVNGFRKLLIEDGKFSIPVDCSMMPEVVDRLEEGCRVQVVGVCVLESESWKPNGIFPKIHGLFLVPRTPEDIRLIARPPWWTPLRLLVAICGLVAALVAILFWNVSLRRAVERKVRQLYRTQLEKTRAELRTTERTRLAVELHDSISQNLTGVSLQIDAARELASASGAKLQQRLDIASLTIDSCRAELRNCIRDLRDNALDNSDLESAIRTTLKPHLEDTVLAIRFKVPRHHLSDNAAHTVLRIVRELAINAIRHGRASRIQVAGALDGGILRFSVADNGCGFDPESCPGLSEGHFGLEGVRERTQDLGGTLDIESMPGSGTRITVTLRKLKSA